MREYRRARVDLFQIEQRPGLELLMHDAGAVPHEHIGAGFAAHVIAQMTIRRPQNFLAAIGQMRDDLHGDAGGHHPIGAGFYGGRGVGIDHHPALRVLVAESREFIRRAAQVERAGGVQGGHQHALFRGENLRRLAHKAHARNHQGAGGMIASEARHFERIRNATAGLLSQRLNLGGGVVVRHQHRIVRPEPVFDERNEFGLAPRRERLTGASIEVMLNLLANRLQTIGGDTHGRPVSATRLENPV